MTTITVLSDVILPEIVMSAGVRGRQIRRNERTQTINVMPGASRQTAMQAGAEASRKLQAAQRNL